MKLLTLKKIEELLDREYEKNFRCIKEIEMEIEKKHLKKNL